MAELTPSQTIGPFFHEALQWAAEASVAPPNAVRVTGAVFDVNDQPVTDALLEIWQPDFVANSPLPGLQRVATGEDGRFTFYMPKPASAPLHANVTLFTRGLLRGLFTRIYLASEASAAIHALPKDVAAERRATLVAARGATESNAYQWDIRLGGARETVFFEF
jgi:protocatechuate 3,4-dioxygenase, alpha subunit